MSAPAPTCWVLIPVKAPGEGKSRLAGALDARGRSALVSAMLARVVEAARACTPVARVFLVGPSDHGLGPAVECIGDEREGLNGTLEAALQRLSGPAEEPTRLPARLIIAAADLPQITGADFAMLARVPAHAVGIAPDRHGTGTNALSLPFSAAGAFRFQFGVGSHAAHRAEAHRLGYTVDTMLSDGLEKDIDESVDLADARGCLQEAL